MRPLRLELQGFTTFRERTVVDFADADLFALVGATGAGKTSVIDGMVFALYGTVPRLDRRAVAPVISTGKVEARIRFDFTVGDEAYTAARVVRRTKAGATTKEARLERTADDAVVAADADSMTRSVEHLLGLTFEQFTKCVLLPQGDFARFLHDKPRDRGDLLVRLLELGIYDRMREAAGKRQVAADSEASVVRRQLEELAHATPEALTAAAGRVADLERLDAELADAELVLDELGRRIAEARGEADDHAAALTVLGEASVPDDVADLAAELAAAEEESADAERAAAEAAQAVDDADAEVAGLPPRPELERTRELRAERDDVGARMRKGGQVVAARRRAAEAAETALTWSRSRVTAAEAALAAAQREHAAHALAGHLVEGQPCPVCLQPVTALPGRDAPAQLAAAETALDEARTAAATAEEDARRRGEELAKAEQRMAELATQLAELDRKLEGAPSPGETEDLLARVVEAEAGLALTREHDRKARAERARAQAALTEHRRRVGAAWSAFDTVRDRLARLEPPPADRADLAVAWTALATWAKTEAATRRKRADDAAARAGELEAQRTKLLERLAARCESTGVEAPAGRSPRDACTQALAGARAAHDHLAREVEQAARRAETVTKLQERANVAGALARHLRADGFERWILDEALERLATGASEVLRDLSSGQYSLAIDDQRAFCVIDHGNADELRPARTLSGGETFLASLALALTLADQIVDLSVQATPKLESIFLDEGFGTLDADTLDVVAAAIEELGARGRTVGIVTHVRDLGERVPVRFEVRKSPVGSTVERVER